MTLQFTLDAQELRKSIKVVKPFVYTDETRFYLNGILFRWTGTQMLLVATDGHRLIERKLRGATFVGDSGDGAFSAIFPRQMLKALITILDNSLLAPVTLTLKPVSESGKHLRFLFSSLDAELAVRAIDGTFPDYARAIPATKKCRNGFNARYLYEALAVFAENGEERELNNMTIDIHYQIETDEREPQIINASGDADTIVVLMPKTA